jgi:hypothetical protein
MIRLLQDFIDQKSTGKTVVLFFVITNLVYTLMLLITIPEVMEYAGGMKLPDMMPTGYDIEYVNTLFQTLGENGRHAYLYHQIPLDMIYPLLFGICYCLLFFWFLKQIKKHKSSFFYFCLLPLISGISDYIENIGMIKMLIQFPAYSDDTVLITNTFSVLKSTTTTFYFLALIVLLLVFFVQFIKTKSNRQG